MPYHVAVVLVGRIDAEEVEAAVARAAKVVRRPLELRDPLPVPYGTEDPARRQHRVSTFLEKLRGEVAKLKPGKLVGDVPEGAQRPRADAFLFVTDVDLHTANTDGVFAALLRPKQSAVVSVRRLREAFYRRRADPVRQRSRLVKEVVRMWGRLQGAPECSDPACAMAPSRVVPDIDTKDEKLCRACEQRLFEGTISV
jgi:predicted Zn-dependent protease